MTGPCLCLCPFRLKSSFLCPFHLQHVCLCPFPCPMRSLICPCLLSLVPLSLESNHLPTKAKFPASSRAGTSLRRWRCGRWGWFLCIASNTLLLAQCIGPCPFSRRNSFSCIVCVPSRFWQRGEMALSRDALPAARSQRQASAKPYPVASGACGGVETLLQQAAT